jgi:hypothetical protein
VVTAGCRFAVQDGVTCGLGGAGGGRGVDRRSGPRLCMAAPGAAGGAGAAQQPGELPAAAVLSWPLPGCRPDSLGDLFSARALAALARVAGAAGGAVALELGGHVLQAPVGGKPGLLHLLESQVPPAGLRSLTLRNGTLALQPGTGVAFACTQPLAVCLERVKLTRPAPSGSGSVAGRRAPGFGGGGKGPPITAMVTFACAVSGLMRQCRVELSPAGPAGDSVRQEACGVCAQDGALVVLEDVDVVARQGAGATLSTSCMAFSEARLELDRCAWWCGVVGCMLFVPWRTARAELGLGVAGLGVSAHEVPQSSSSISTPSTTLRKGRLGGQADRDGRSSAQCCLAHCCVASSTPSAPIASIQHTLEHLIVH